MQESEGHKVLRESQHISETTQTKGKKVSLEVLGVQAHMVHQVHKAYLDLRVGKEIEDHKYVLLNC